MQNETRFTINDSRAGFSVVDSLTGKFSAFYQYRSDAESISNEMNRHADAATLACWSGGKPTATTRMRKQVIANRRAAGI